MQERNIKQVPDTDEQAERGQGYLYIDETGKAFLMPCVREGFAVSLTQ
jgi:hypothetical protein